MMRALRINGVKSRKVVARIKPKANLQRFLVGNWKYNASTTGDPAKWNFSFSAGVGSDMLPGGPDYGDLTSLPGAPGQNSPTPTEKIFEFHEFLSCGSGSDIRYFDPSYGKTYKNAADFEAKAVQGYGRLLPAPAGGQQKMFVFKPKGGEIIFKSK